MATALDFVRDSGIIIASDGAEYEQIAEFNPTDATTNPSLVARAVTSQPYAHILDEAISYAVRRPGELDAQVEVALDRILVQVGVQISKIIPGRVSLSVDPRLGYDYDAILSKSRALISLANESSLPRSKVLIKIPATFPGIRAAHTLESEFGIRTNLTLIFSLSQAIACAQAGVSVISPFVGRVKDWFACHGGVSENVGEHPGIELVRRIRAAYRAYGYNTQVMAAGFRAPEEIVELARGGREVGPDLFTLPPDLLSGLRTLPFPILSPPTRIIHDSPEPIYFPDEQAFTAASEAERIALDKVPEGLEKFSVDMRGLEEKVRGRIILSRAEISSSPRVKRDGWAAH